MIVVDKEAFAKETEKLIARFKGISLKARTKVGRALQRVGAVVSTEAKKILGENKSVVTNRLRSSITFRLAADESYVEIGTNVGYAPFVEYGWKYEGFSTRYARGRGRVSTYRERKGGPRVDTAFLRPALARKIAWAREEIRKAVKESVE